MEGIVIKSTGKWYDVQLENGQMMPCQIKGKFRLDKVKLTNPIAVGDKVEITPEKGQKTGMIVKLFPRQNYVLRQSTRNRRQMHLLASNIDQAFVIVTIQHPTLKPGFIDRFILTTETHEIPTYIIVNKADLYDEDDMELYHGLAAIYNEIGYPTLLVSAATGEGIDALKEILKDKITLLSGHSGVGKSSLVNAIQPGLEINTKEISDYSGKGVHTTTFAQMHNLDFGGQIIDTPGIKELGFINIEPTDVGHNFREIWKTSKDCKFSNCLHINEPHCAVKDAVETNEISPIRYQSYLSIMDDVMNQNSWEIETEW